MAPRSYKEANPMNYTDWVNAIGGQAEFTPVNLSLWCLEEDQYFDINFESWTSGNNGGGFSYWRTGVEPPEGPNVHIVWGLMEVMKPVMVPLKILLQLLDMQ